jgi:type IV pilus assembly protein PilM
MSRFSFSLADAPAPTAAVEITSGRVSGVRLDDRGGRPVVVAHASEVLDDTAVVPSLTATNVRDRGAVAGALTRVLDQIGRPSRIGLVLGDPVAKVSIVRLQQVPSRAADLEQVIRWQVRKSAPFPLEEAQVGYGPGQRGSDGQDFIVTLARRDVIVEYESLCREAGAHAGIVDLSSFNVVNAVLAAGTAPLGDWLLINLAKGWESIGILRSRQLIFFRSRTADGEGTLADLVHETAMFYEDRLSGAGFNRALLCGASTATDPERLRQSLESRLGTPVGSVDPRGAAALAESSAVSAAALDALAPLVGLVLRTREAA